MRRVLLQAGVRIEEGRGIRTEADYESSYEQSRGHGWHSRTDEVTPEKRRVRNGVPHKQYKRKATAAAKLRGIQLDTIWRAHELARGKRIRPYRRAVIVGPMADAIYAAVDCGCCVVDEAMVQKVANYLETRTPDEDRVDVGLVERGAELYYFGLTLKA